jgi:hypothetical protein
MKAFASTTHYSKRRKEEPVSAENLPFDACNESVNDRTTSKLEAKEQQQQPKCRCCMYCHCHHRTVHTFKEIMARFKKSLCNVNKLLLDVSRHPQTRVLQREFTDEMDVYINSLEYFSTCKEQYFLVYFSPSSPKSAADAQRSPPSERLAHRLG